MVARAELFNAYIAASPSLTWDDDYPLRAVEAFFKDRKEFKRTLFVTMADEEARDPKPTRFDRLCATLGSVKADGFLWGAMLMEDETHGTVVLRSHYWGLRKIFDGWGIPLDRKTGRYAGKLEDVKSHYATLGKKMGMTLQPPEQTVNLLGYQFLGQGPNEEAVAIFKYNIELYPDSPNVYDSLGEALERAGRMEEALSNYGKAVEKAQKAKDNRLEIFTRNRDRAAAAVKSAKKAG
jgi:tetratricopeptide (TPR) repeat protein